MAFELSPREKQLLSYIVEGKTDKQIAHALCLSVETVKTIGANMRAKLGAINRVHAAALAIQQGRL